ncbi:MAG: IS1 family transposase [Elusimicrobia bacterium]|nr:IS1 family transposase [Elusimicrobiota bacterium]
METGIEERLLDSIRRARWAHGLRCPRCASERCGLFMRLDASGRRKLRCLACGRVFNDLTGTPMARTHLPLASWHRAARLMLGGEPACAELSQRLGVKIAVRCEWTTHQHGRRQRHPSPALPSGLRAGGGPAMACGPRSRPP